MSKKKREKRKLKRKLDKINKVSNGKSTFLRNMSIKLNKNLPKSEIWFNNQMKHANLNIKDLKPNAPFLGYIPDYRSDRYKLIIEVDGNIHKNSDIREKDKIKQSLYEKAGYTVIRVVAYNENSLYSCFSKIKLIFNEFNSNS